MMDLPVGDFNLELGETLQKNKRRAQYHHLRRDFKPQSATSRSSETFIELNDGNVQLATITSSDQITVYKGTQSDVKGGKECLLFFDPDTSTFRLEKLSSTISVKKDRDGNMKKELRARILKEHNFVVVKEEELSVEEKENKESKSDVKKKSKSPMEEVSIKEEEQSDEGIKKLCKQESITDLESTRTTMFIIDESDEADQSVQDTVKKTTINNKKKKRGSTGTVSRETLLNELHMSSSDEDED